MTDKTAFQSGALVSSPAAWLRPRRRGPRLHLSFGGKRRFLAPEVKCGGVGDKTTRPQNSTLESTSMTAASGLRFCSPAQNLVDNCHVRWEFVGGSRWHDDLSWWPPTVPLPL